MKKEVAVFIFSCAIIGCKSSADNPTTPDQSVLLNNKLVNEQEEQTLRNAPLGDEKEIRCDFIFNSESKELFTRSTRKPAILKFSKYQIQKYVCSGNFQNLYETDSFDIDCYEIKTGKDESNKVNAAVISNGFSAKYRIECPSELPHTDYYYQGIANVSKDSTINCEIDYRRTSHEYGYTPNFTNLISTQGSFDRNRLSKLITENLCKTKRDFNNFVYRCELIGDSELDNEMYLKVTCPGKPEKQYDENLKNIPSHAKTSLKCNINSITHKHSSKNKPSPKNIIASETINLFRKGTSNDEEIQAYFTNKYCNYKSQSIYQNNKFDIDCYGKDIDAYNNIIKTDVTKNYQITCPPPSPVDYNAEGSGKKADVLCNIDDYYTLHEFDWSVHAASSYAFYNISFDRNTLTKTIKNELCKIDNDRMLVGSQINGKEFVVYCHTPQSSSTQESMYIKTDCKDVPKIVLNFKDNSQNNIDNSNKKLNDSDRKDIYQIRSYIGKLTSNSNSNPYTFNKTTNTPPEEAFTEENVKLDTCNNFIVKMYGNSFDIDWQEANLIDNQYEPMFGGFHKTMHIDCSNVESLKQNVKSNAPSPINPIQNLDISYQGSGKFGSAICSTDHALTQKYYGYLPTSFTIKQMGDVITDPKTGKSSVGNVKFDRKTIDSLLIPKFCPNSQYDINKPVIVKCLLNQDLQTQKAEDEMLFKLNCSNPDGSSLQDNVPSAKNAPDIDDNKLFNQNSGKSPDLAFLMNKPEVKPIDYSCKLALPNSRKAITVVSDKTMPPLSSLITENWAVDNFCSEKLQIEHKSSNFTLSCYQTQNGRQTSKSIPIDIQFKCPPIAKIDYKESGSGIVGFVSCRTDSVHTQKEFNWVLDNDFGFAIPGDIKFNRKYLTSPVKQFLCRNSQVQNKKVVVRCELNNNPQNKTSEDNIYLKINCN